MCIFYTKVVITSESDGYFLTDTKLSFHPVPLLSLKFGRNKFEIFL